MQTFNSVPPLQGPETTKPVPKAGKPDKQHWQQWSTQQYSKGFSPARFFCSFSNLLCIFEGWLKDIFGYPCKCWAVNCFHLSNSEGRPLQRLCSKTYGTGQKRPTSSSQKFIAISSSPVKNQNYAGLCEGFTAWVVER